MWSSSKLGCVLVVCASTLVGASAFAQTPAAASDPSPADVASAKAQFAEAMDLRANGDLAGALQRFRAAYGFVPTPITGLEVGRTLVQLGRPVEARTVVLEAANMPKKPGESERAAQARTESAMLASELEGRVGTLDVQTDPDAESVMVDDKPVAPASRNALMVDPGHHVVVVRAAKGRVGRAEVDVGAGEHKEVRVAAVAESAPETRLRISPVAYVGFGVAGAGLLVGIGTGIGALATASTVKRDCPNGLCPPSAHGTLDTSLALGTTSNVAFIVGGVGAAVGVVGLLLSKRVATNKTALVIGPGSVALKGEF